MIGAIVAAVMAAVMAASFFMPWAEAFGTVIGPTALFGENAPPIADFPWQAWAFLASFVIAALAAIQALSERAAGVLMMTAGVIPFGLIAQQVTGARGRIEDLGLPVPGLGNPSDALDLAREIVAFGLLTYFISAALLVVLGLGRALRAA
jgi:hypothetical protein